MEIPHRSGLKQQLALAALLAAMAWPVAHFAGRFFSKAERPEYVIPGYAEVVVAGILLAMGVAAGVAFLAKRGLATTFSALAVGAGIVLGLGLAFLTIVGQHQPLVACLDGGVRTSDACIGGAEAPTAAAAAREG